MLDTNPNNLIEEIKAAERLRDGRLRKFKDQREHYHGPAYTGVGDEYYPENHYFEYISLVVPKVIFDNPRVRVTTRRTGTQHEVAEALRHGLNRWCKDVDLRKVLTKSAVDMMFNWSVLLVREIPDPGYRPGETSSEGVPTDYMRPSVYRIDQRHFFIDPLAIVLEDARYYGHKIARDKEDLLADARRNPDDWDVSQIDDMGEDDRAEEYYRKPVQQAPPRNEVQYYEVWIPEHQLDDEHTPDKGFHGTIFTIANTSTGERGDGAMKYLRKPRAYYGPKWGPYCIAGVYSVPGEQYPLSPLTVVEGQIEDLNLHVLAAQRAENAYKRCVLYNQKDTKTARQIQANPDLYFVGVPDVDKSTVVPIEVGGSSPTQHAYIQMKRDRLDRVSGLFDAQRGNVEGQGTATEVAVANEASTARMAFLKQQFTDFTQKVLSTVAWYMYHDDRVVFPLGTDTADEMGMEPTQGPDGKLYPPEPWFYGGSFDVDSGATFQALELEIEPYSMERTSEGVVMQRTMQAFELIMQSAPVMPQVDWVDWDELIEKMGEAMNMPDLGRLINMDRVREVTGAMAEAGEGQRPVQPRLGGDVGQAGMLPQSNFRRSKPEAKKLPSGPTPGGAQQPKTAVTGGVG
jgi:hypothetical protein